MPTIMLHMTAAAIAPMTIPAIIQAANMSATSCLA
jgi:hypothetical protein